MKDFELQNTSWKFVNIKNGEKVPVGYGWQKYPQFINEIYTDNVGVVLGPHSQGLCTIDVDGIEVSSPVVTTSYSLKRTETIGRIVMHNNVLHRIYC